MTAPESLALGTDMPAPPPASLLGGLRRRTARGTLVNATFLVGLNGLNLLRGFVVAGYLTRAEYGIWGILSITLTTLLSLKQIGVTEKYVQQEDDDQEAAFQRAFTVEILFTASFIALALAGMPLLALAYGESAILLPGWVLTLGVAAIALQSPLWVFYRRMEFMRQRTLQAAEPIVGFVVTVALAVAGAGYWSLVVGAVAGSWAAAILAMRASPYRLRLRLGEGTLRTYVSFSWPLLAATLGGLVVSQASIFAGKLAVGLSGVGAMVLAYTISLYVQKVDDIVSQTLYPAVCAVRDRADLLFETFVTSNRLALLWGIPFGVGVAIFADDLIRFGIGERWRPAHGVIAAFALIAAGSQIGFNWKVYFQARDETRPIAVAAAAMLGGTLLLAVPLLFVAGLDGYAAGVAAAAAMQLAVRLHYLRRLFPDLGVVRQSFRGIAPTVPATALLLGLRAITGPASTGAIATAEVVLFAVVVAGSTAVLERGLVREVLGYLRAAPAAPA